MLSIQELAILRAWIDLGAPLKSGTQVGATPEPSPGPTPEPTPDATPMPTPSVPLEPKFSSIKAWVFERKCLQCHGPSGKTEKIPLSTIDDLLNSPRELVIAGSPDESGLVIAIERSDKKRMPPLKAGPALSQKEIDTIRLWISNGAKE